MSDKRESLKKAFDEAWSSNAAMLSGDLKYEVIETAMKAIMKRDYIEATDEEVLDVIQSSLKELQQAGADFKIDNKFQNKMML